MYPYYFSSGYLFYILISLPALLLGIWAQIKVKTSFSKYSKVRNANGLTGAEVARRILDRNGLYNVEIEMTQGFLSDHYDPGAKKLRLSPDVYRNPTIAAAGIAAHETGHALQDQDHYFPMQIRTAMVPTVQIGSWLGPIIFMVGLLIATTFGQQLAWVGLILFAATAVFSILTLPVEINASNRAKQWLSDTGIATGMELQGVNQVLDAAALTYVAAAIQCITTVLYYAMLLTGRSRND